MIKVKSKLTKIDKIEVGTILDNLIDYYGDFYITKNNLRLFIKDNKVIFFNCLDKGDIIAYNKDGIAFLTGFSDKAKRIYLKVLGKTVKDMILLTKEILLHYRKDIYLKIKKINPFSRVVMGLGFSFFGGRGKEILYYRKGE